ncbi:MAG TPA: hypothetical protein PLQ35_14450 [bacterium]|nr:hypothetical protein [bacterium]
MNAANKIPIFNFERSETEQVRGTAWRHRGRKYLDCRLFVRKGDRWIATREGITFREHEIQRLQTAAELAIALPVKID